MGLYMMSNPEIFPADVHDENKVIAGFESWSVLISDLIVYITGVDSARFYQVHTILYSLGITIFCIIFIIEKFTGLLTTILEKGIFCCLHIKTEKKTFSSDIY